MADTVAELNALVASVPKRADDPNLKAAIEAVDPDAVRTKLQKQLKEERGRTARLAKELDVARARIASQAALISMINTDDAPLPPSPEIIRDTAAENEAKARATKAERHAEELGHEVNALKQQVAFLHNAAKDDRAATMHEGNHRRAAEQQVRDTKKATDDDIARRVAVQIEKARDEIQRETRSETRTELRKELIGVAMREARTWVEDELHRRILTERGQEALDKQLDAELREAIKAAEQS
jgi:hypothetical protein